MNKINRSSGLTGQQRRQIPAFKKQILNTRQSMYHFSRSI